MPLFERNYRRMHQIIRSKTQGEEDGLEKIEQCIDNLVPKNLNSWDEWGGGGRG